MTEPFAEEVLSAYFDGELPPEQRAQVERWLETSPRAQQTLAQMRQVSAGLRSLPRAELPAEFAAQVLQEAERQMLLPVAAAARPPRPIRAWLFAAGGLATAALLLVTMQLADRAPQRAAAPNLAAAPGDVLRSEGTGGEGRFASAAMPAATANEAADLNALAGVDLSDPELQKLVDAIRSAQATGRVPVVRLYVFDRKADLDVVQWVLERQEIHSDPVGGARTVESGKEIVAKTVPGRAENRALREGQFVIAELPRLVGALQALSKTDARFKGWQVGPAIDLASLDERGQQRAREWAELPNDEGPLIADARGTSADLAHRASKDEGGAAGAAATRIAEVPPAKASIPGRDQTSNAAQLAKSRQLRVTLTESPENLGAPPPEPRQFNVQKPTSAADNVAAFSQEKVRNAASTSQSNLVRVIIVVEPAAGDKRPEPPAKPATGTGAA
ncbi:MAG: anti-sigma factor family protein [Planctomycetaceae bacterium]